VLAVVAVLALVGLLAYGLVSNEPDSQIDEAVARGEREAAPALTLPRLSGGGEESLADYRGRVVVLNYWASWCDPCRAESPLLQRFHERIARRGGTVLGVDVQDVTGDAIDFAKEYGLTYPMLRDGDGDTRDELGIVGLPETFVLDRRGRIAAVARGPVDAEFLREEVLPLLEESA
jgi:cytochrome c biogenesis protein CcmG/thiol:disulfide interchange protein DsbE